jgi:hypothetical protein
MTPIGNPQNMLIAVTSNMQAPFITFVKALAVPTLINLVVTPLLLLKMMRVKNERVAVLASPWEAIRNRRDAVLAAVGLAAAVGAMVANDIAALSGVPHIHNIGLIPFIVAMLLYFFVTDPRDVISRVDWGTMLFFAASHEGCVRRRRLATSHLSRTAELPGHSRRPPGHNCTLARPQPSPKQRPLCKSLLDLPNPCRR